MKRHYEDILNLSLKAPKWFDENGVPRFCNFSPVMCADVYADEVVLMAIQCQGCRHEFQVCISSDVKERLRRGALEDDVRGNQIHYGDPPNIGCCAGGTSMNSIPVRVIEFWKAPGYIDSEWTRDASLEREIKCDWYDEELDA